LPSRIVRGLGKIGDLLLNAGKSIIRGLVRGIKSMASAPVDAVKGIVGKVRDFLPFSPAKEGPLSGRGSPEIAGATLVEMIADGMQSEVGDLARMAERAAAAALPTLLNPELNGRATFGKFDVPKGAAAGSAADRDGGVRQQPTEVHVFIGDRELTDIVRTEVDGTLQPVRSLARSS